MNYSKKTPQYRKTLYKIYTKILKKTINSAQKNCNNKYMVNAKNKNRGTWNIINNKDRHLQDKHLINNRK